MELFRYRSFARGLQEIQEQTIYFAPREALNDPVAEGFLYVYWQGDCIAWEGLFRNYVCSLYHVVTLYLLKAERSIIKESAVMVDIHWLDDVPAGKILEKLGDAFLQCESVLQFTIGLSEEKPRISRDELLLFLYTIHQQALLEVLNASIEANYREESFVAFRDKLASSVKEKKIPALKDFLKEDIAVRQKLLHNLVNLHEDYYNRHIAEISEEQRKTWMSVACNFPKIYIDYLENLIHPETYVACFSASGSNNAMWGQYAENHTGVCLIYDTHASNGRECIAMRRKYGVSPSGEEYEKYADETFYPIKYGGNVCEANFFTTLGRLNGKQLHDWLASKDGKRSCCLDAIYAQEDKWREKYWQLLYDRYCHKTKDWEYEQEYRLLLVNFFFDYTKPESRAIKYHFSDLKGIILGEKMSPENRKIILDAVMGQCEKYGRDDFKVYVAEYDHNTDSVTKRPFYG